MNIADIMVELFNFSRPTYFKKKREQIQILQLLDRYFSKEELEEFLKNSKIRKFELIKDLTLEECEEKFSSPNMPTISLTQISSKFLSMKQVHRRSLRVLLKNSKKDELLIENLDKLASEHTFYVKLKSFFKDDEFLLENHFFELKILWPIIFSKDELKFMDGNKDLAIKQLNILIQNNL